MKLAGKLTLSLWAAILTILGINGYDRYSREAVLFETDMTRDHVVMGRGIRAAVTEIWEHEGQDRALQVIESANQRESDVVIRWVDTGDHPADIVAPAAKLADLAPMPRSDARNMVDRKDTGRVYTYVPLTVKGESKGAIELSESLAAERAYLRESMVRVGLVTGLLTVLSGLISFAIGASISRPVALLAEKARRIAQGDFSGDIGLRQADELGYLAREMDLMARALATARVELDASSTERLAAVEQLRHAERVATVGQLASGIAHELGTPLNVIAWRARNIASGKVEGDVAKDNARVALEQTERITRIVRQLLDFARRSTPEVGRVDLVELASQSLGLLEPAARKQGVIMRVTGDQTPRFGRVDRSQMQQVLTNLALNGIQAMARGKELVIEVGEAEADAPSGLAGRRWHTITVIDQGVGISPELIERVFDPFFTTKGVGEGTGLGLSVAWGIVRDHGGFIAVSAQPGVGSRFVVHLPVEPT